MKRPNNGMKPTAARIVRRGVARLPLAAADYAEPHQGMGKRYTKGIRSEAPMSTKTPVVHSDPEILGGTPVFVGTRVPFQNLLDYLEAGDPLDEFLKDFPSVTREQAVAALEQAKEALLAHACPPR